MGPSDQLGLTVDLSTAAVTVPPGSEAHVEVRIRNISQVVQHYQAGVVGAPADRMWQVTPEVIKLRPGESGTLDLTLRVPPDAPVTGGDYDLGVLVRSPYQPEVSRAAELLLTVGSTTGVAMMVEPQVIEDTSAGQCTVSVHNSGNTPQLLAVSASDDQGKATFGVNPPQQWIPPGGTAYARVAWEVPGFFSGQERRSTITVQARTDRGGPSEARVTFIQRPRVPATALRVLGAALALVVIAGAILASGLISGRLAVPGASQSHSEGPTQPAAATEPATPTPMAPASPAATPTPADTPTPLHEPTDATGPLLATATKEVTAAPGSSRHEVACPAGRQPVSGGISADAASRFTIISNGPTNTGWAVTVHNGDTAAIVEVAAVCANPIPGYVVRRQETTATDSLTEVRATCPAGTAILGGGGGLMDPPTGASGTLLESHPDQHGESGRWDRWSAVLETPDPIKVEAWALCAEAPEGYRVTVTPEQKSGSGDLDLALTCPEASFMSAGVGLDRQQALPGESSMRMRVSGPVVALPEGAPEWWRIQASYTMVGSHTVNGYAVCIP